MHPERPDRSLAERDRQTSYETNSLLRIDPGSNEVVASIPLGDDAAPEGVGVTPGAVWVAVHHQGTVARIDPSTNAVVSRIQVGPPGRHGPLKLATGASGVWVDVPNLGAVVHIDPARNAVAGKVSPGGVPAVGDHGVWVVAPTSIRRIDPTSNRATTTISMPGTAVDGAVGLGSVWVTTSTGLVPIDEETNRIVGKLGIAHGDVAVGAGSVWVAQYDTGRLLRIAPQ